MRQFGNEAADVAQISRLIDCATSRLSGVLNVAIVLTDNLASANRAIGKEQDKKRKQDEHVDAMPLLCFATANFTRHKSREVQPATTKLEPRRMVAHTTQQQFN